LTKRISYLFTYLLNTAKAVRRCRLTSEFQCIEVGWKWKLEKFLRTRDAWWPLHSRPADSADPASKTVHGTLHCIAESLMDSVPATTVQRNPRPCLSRGALSFNRFISEKL